MVNPKATTIIKRLEKLKKHVEKCGILAESISPEQHLMLDKLSHFFTREFWALPTQAVLRLDRLKYFVSHLKTSKLVQPFDPGYYSYAAELPLIFPQQWKTKTYRWDNETKDRIGAKYLPLDCNTYEGIRFFFGLTKQQQAHLCSEYNQNPEWGNIKMTGRTGKAKFIENMEQFIAFFEKGGEND